MRISGLLVSVVMSALLVLSGHAAKAQGLAGKSVRIIVPYPAGGAGDVITRVLASQITESGGPAFVVENRPGAGSIVGSDAAARATPDGMTILLVENPFILGSVLHPTIKLTIEKIIKSCFI